MIQRFFKHSFFVGCLLFALSVTDSYARPRFEVDYSGVYNQGYGSRSSYRYSGGYGDYSYREGYRNGRRFQRRRQGNYYRRSGYYGNYGRRYCPTPRRYRNRRRW